MGYGTPKQATNKGSESLPDSNYPFGNLARIGFIERSIGLSDLAANQRAAIQVNSN
jgi:hypothetical protein